MRVVAAVPAAALLVGAAVGLLLTDPPLAVCYLLLALSVGGAIAARGTGAVPVLVAVALGFFAGGVLLASAAWQRAWRPPLRAVFERLARDERAQAALDGRRLPEDDEAFAIVEGTLRADASPGDAGVSLSVAVDRPAAGGVIVTVVGSLAAEYVDAWRAGRRVRFPVTLHRPARYLDPGVPDHERDLARRGTTLVGTVKSGALVDVVARAPAIDEALGAVRAFARRTIAAGVGRWSAQSAAIVAAIVIGDRAGLSADVQRRLQDAGTYHVIAISGGNIAILAGVLLGAFRLAGWLGRTAMLAAIVLLLAYARLVGDGASVDRATLMAVVYFGARLLDHRSPPLNSLAVVAAILVAADPLSIVDPAFLLTFGATLAILLVVPVATPARGRRWLGPVAAMLAASAAAEAMVLPIGAVMFSRITFAGLALNFAAIPLMAVAQLAGMALVPIALASQTAAALVGWIAHAGAAGLVRSADLARVVPALSYRTAPPSWIAAAVYYIGLACAWTLWRRRVIVSGSGEHAAVRVVRRAANAVAAAAALWILIDPRTLVSARGDGRLHVTFIDVGQGDSAFVVFPRGSTLLVDAGGLATSSSFDVGDRVVAPVIREAGFRRIDFLALTHGDPDHIGGAPAIVAEFRPREAWEGIPVPRFEPLTALRVQTQASGARWANVYAGDFRIVDGVTVTVRHPRQAEWERQKVRNDDSIVLDLRWRGVSVLLTGDIGRATEHTIAPLLPPAPLRIVKIPHHGSLTSSTEEFVRAIHPTIAVASAGRNNHFGHPVPEVLERYVKAGAEVFRTDREGAVTIDTNGESVEVHGFTGRRLLVSATPSLTPPHALVPPPALHEGTKISEVTKP